MRTQILNKSLFKQTLKETNPDLFTFLPPDQGSEDMSLKFQLMNWKNKSEKINGSELGDCYDIILFRLNDDYTYKEKPDRFEAILIDPSEYLPDLISAGYYGIAGRKTTRSNDFFDQYFETLTKK